MNKGTYGTSTFPWYIEVVSCLISSSLSLTWDILTEREGQ